MDILFAFGLLIVIGQCNGAQSSFPEESSDNNEDRVNLHPGRVILYRPIKTNLSPAYHRNYYRDYEEEKHRFPLNAHRDYSYRPKPHDYNDYKLPASKYTNDYFQRPRPTPQPVTPNHRSQTRSGFTFPDVHITSQDHYYWSPRGAGQQNVNNNQIPRSRYQSRPAVITYDNGDLSGKTRPALVQHDTGLPVEDADIIVSSGPGGIKHIIHDLRKPGRQLINLDNADNAAPLKIPERGFKPGFVVHRFSSVPNEHVSTNYKGVPVFLEGGTFRGKEYDPRFVTLYRQVLEENQKKLIPRFRIKTKPFNPSPTVGWFSEPDPIFHSHNLPTITANPELTTFTAVPAISEFPGQFPDSINSQLPPPTGNENTDIPYVSVIATTTPSPSSTTESGMIQADESSVFKPDKFMLMAEPSQQSATQISSEKSVLNRITSQSKDTSTETSEAETTLKASKTDNNRPHDTNLNTAATDLATTTGTDIISTSVSKSITSQRARKPSDILDTSKETTTLEALVPTHPPSTETIQVEKLQATEATTTEVIDVTTSGGDFNTLASDAVEAIITTAEPASDVANSRQSATLAEARTQSPTTLVTEVALTTLNFLVMSLVNQARANSIIDDDASTISSMEYTTTTS